MGQSTNAILAYGFNLEGGENEWQIEEADEYGSWTPPWASDEDDLITDAERVLLAAAGFTETDWKVDGFFAREQAAKDQLGVEFDSHCSGDYPMWMLVAHKVTAHRGHCQMVDFAELEARREAEDWDGKLNAAARTLGITPKQGKPRWMLVSYWG